MCGQCIDIIRNQTKCPQDQVSFGINNLPLDQLPTNYPLLIILYESLQVIEKKRIFNLFICFFFCRLVT
jgi:hypothetical protein